MNLDLPPVYTQGETSLCCLDGGCDVCREGSLLRTGFLWHPTEDASRRDAVLTYHYNLGYPFITLMTREGFRQSLNTKSRM